MIQICNWVSVNIGKGCYGIEQTFMFWKMVDKEVVKLQMTDTNKFKTRFTKGMFCESLTICMTEIFCNL